MRKYGLRIGNIGVEFTSIEDRQKAILAFTNGTTVTISTSKIKYRDADGAFSVYDRDTEFIVVICNECLGEFSNETAPIQTYEQKPSYSDSYNDVTEHICEACLVAVKKGKEIFDAKQGLKNTKEEI